MGSTGIGAMSNIGMLLPTSPSLLLLSLAPFALLCVVAWLLLKPLTWPLRHLPSPPNPHFALGHFYTIHFGDPLPKYNEWARRYGNVVGIRGPLNMPIILLSDLKAVNHVFNNYFDYEKSSMARRGLAMLIGNGLVVAEGEQHKRQRRALNPSFYPATLKDLVPIFFEQAQELRNVLGEMIDKELGKEKGKEGMESLKVDMYKWFGAAILNMIGLSAFDYNFNALRHDENDPNELFTALHDLYHGAPTGMTDQWIFLRLVIPELRLVSGPRRRQLKQALATWRRIGIELVSQRKRAMYEGKVLPSNVNSNPDSKSKSKANSSPNAESGGRDLLTSLVRANADPDVPEAQKLSEEEVLSQVPTFLVTGHETTATAISWCLFALAQRPTIQQTLRNELLSLPTDHPSIDALNALPYLDAVIRECSRLHPAIPYTMRVVCKDDVIPLSNPYRNTKGNLHIELPVQKGDHIIIPLEAINRYESIWGADAAEFKPERWLDGKFESGINSAWGGMMTFLGGPRACIGYRFALWEEKVLLFTLLRAYEFELSGPVEDVANFRYISSRPWVRSEEGRGVQMPLRVRKVGGERV